jgi:hypothetical protein
MGYVRWVHGMRKSKSTNAAHEPSFAEQRIGEVSLVAKVVGRPSKVNNSGLDSICRAVMMVFITAGNALRKYCRSLRPFFELPP